VSTGEQVGYLFASLGIPAIGLVLLIVGIVRQSKESKQHYQPGYPPQVGYPHPGQYPAQRGFPAQPGYPQPGQYPPQPGQYPPRPGQYQQWPGQYPQQPIRRSSSSKTLIIVGAIMLGIGVLGFLGRAANAGNTHRSHGSSGEYSTIEYATRDATFEVGR
jgi:hypothetical protein